MTNVQKSSRQKISVVMSVFNVMRRPIMGIETTISQSYSDFEFIIVDDGSNRQTKDILKKYAESDTRIKLLVNDRNMKLASSLNRAVGQAKGEYIARADCNVEYREDRLKKQLNFMDNHPDVDIVGSNFYWATIGRLDRRYLSLPRTHREIVRGLSRGNCVCHPSVFFRKSRFLPFGPYKEGFGKGQDYYLWMVARKSLKFYNIQEPLLVKWHRANPGVNRLLEYCLNDIRIRIAGLKTSPNPIRDVFYFLRCLKFFLQV